jgi:hypothetical protein
MGTLKANGRISGLPLIDQHRSHQRSESYDVSSSQRNRSKCVHSLPATHFLTPTSNTGMYIHLLTFPHLSVPLGNHQWFEHRIMGKCTST